MRSIVRLLPIAAMLAVAAALTAPRASANTTAVTATPTGNGTSFSITAIYTNSPAGAAGALQASGPGVFQTATATGGTGVAVTAFTPGTTQIRVSPDTSGVITNSITIQATFTCSAPGQATFVLTQAGGTPATSSSAPVTCMSGTAGAAGANVQPGPTPFTGYNTTYNAQTQQPQYAAGQYPTGQYPAGTQQTQLSGQPHYPTQGSGLQFPNQATGGLPTANNSSQSSSLVSVVASPSSVSCGGTSSLTITARGANGSPASDGTSVSLYTTSGSLEPKTGSTKGGTFQTTFTAPATAGTATISASAGGGLSTTDLTIACTGGAASSSVLGPTGQAISSPPPPPPPARNAASGSDQLIIRPPSTGDAGLLALREAPASAP